jgi:hypothetical protein
MRLSLICCCVVALGCQSSAEAQEDSCRWLTSSEVEPYVGALATPPYLTEDGCMYRGRDGRSVVVTVGRAAGAGAVGKTVTDVPKKTDPQAAKLLAGPTGPWDRSMWSLVGELMVWKGDAQIIVDVSASEAGQSGASELAKIIVGRLGHPLNYDGAKAALLAPKPHAKLANACDLIPRARVQQILGPLKGNPITDEDGTKCTYQTATESYPMAITWSGGYRAFDRVKHTLPMSSGAMGTPQVSMPKLDSSQQKMLGGLMQMVGGSATGAPVKTSFKTDTTLRGPWDAAALINGSILGATRHDVMVAFDLKSADYDKAKALLAAACERL